MPTSNFEQGRGEVHSLASLSVRNLKWRHSCTHREGRGAPGHKPYHLVLYSYCPPAASNIRFTRPAWWKLTASGNRATGQPPGSSAARTAASAHSWLPFGLRVTQQGWPTRQQSVASHYPHHRTTRARPLGVSPCQRHTGIRTDPGRCLDALRCGLLTASSSPSPWHAAYWPSAGRSCS